MMILEIDNIDILLTCLHSLHTAINVKFNKGNGCILGSFWGIEINELDLKMFLR